MPDQRTELLEAMHAWHKLYQDEAARSAKMLHVIVTMLAEGGTFPSCGCAHCEQVRVDLEQRGYLPSAGEE